MGSGAQTSDAPGKIAEALVARGVLDAEQVAYARRVHARLRAPRPLLLVLKDLDLVGDEDVRAVLSEGDLHVRLGELLIELGLIDEDMLESALEIQRRDAENERHLGAILVDLGRVDEAPLYEALAAQLGMPLVHPRASEIPSHLRNAASAAACREHRFLPVGEEEGATLVAFADPLDAGSMAAAHQLFPGEILRAVASPSALEAVWKSFAVDTPVVRLQRGGEDIVQIVDGLLNAAVDEDASDIHIEPVEGALRVRFRTDGVLARHRDFPLEIAGPLTSRCKILAGADIAERRRHQDGRFEHRANHRTLDVRASFYVTSRGEKVVLRLLNRERPLLSIDRLGLPPAILERFLDDGLLRPSGVILVTGPTGSGKTTTLYSCIHHIQDDDVAIITAEDPVEYEIDGIAQCTLNSEVERDYRETLRHIVRQDPDVIVIGEIRDAFSAETAIQAALTGHKVITTFHTEDTIGGLLRLLNMNIEAFLISSTVVSVLAQRLLRRVCEDCAVPYTPTPVDLRRLGYTGQNLAGAGMRIGRGCNTCRHTGYKGRVAVFELLVLGDEIRDAIIQHKTSQQIREVSRESNGLVSLFEDGILKAAKGLTTVEELIRVLPRLDVPRPLPDLLRLVGD